MLAAHVPALSTPASAGTTLNGVWHRVGALAATTVDRLAQLSCGLTGHTTVVRFEPTRMSLTCLNCGHNTHGWTIQSRTSTGGWRRG